MSLDELVCRCACCEITDLIMDMYLVPSVGRLVCVACSIRGVEPEDVVVKIADCLDEYDPECVCDLDDGCPTPESLGIGGQ